MSVTRIAGVSLAHCIASDRRTFTHASANLLKFIAVKTATDLGRILGRETLKALGRLPLNSRREQ
jgi:hypothetical protein